MPDRAVILPQRGSVPIDKQTTLILRYCLSSGYHLAGMGNYWRSEDAVAMIRNGRADLIVVAYGGSSLAADVADVGGRVEAVHPQPHVVAPARHRHAAAVVDMITRWWRHGMGAKEIARLVDDDTANITKMLDRIDRKDPKRRRT